MSSSATPAAAAAKRFAIEAWTLLAVAILITILRTYARTKAVGLRKLQADDYLVWVSLVSLFRYLAVAFTANTRILGILRS